MIKQSFLRNYNLNKIYHQAQQEKKKLKVYYTRYMRKITHQQMQIERLERRKKIGKETHKEEIQMASTQMYYRYTPIGYGKSWTADGRSLNSTLNHRSEDHTPNKLLAMKPKTNIRIKDIIFKRKRMDQFESYRKNSDEKQEFIGSKTQKYYKKTNNDQIKIDDECIKFQNNNLSQSQDEHNNKDKCIKNNKNIVISVNNSNLIAPMIIRRYPYNHMQTYGSQSFSSLERTTFLQQKMQVPPSPAKTPIGYQTLQTRKAGHRNSLINNKENIIGSVEQTQNIAHLKKGTSTVNQIIDAKMFRRVDLQFDLKFQHQNTLKQTKSVPRKIQSKRLSINPSFVKGFSKLKTGDNLKNDAGQVGDQTGIFTML